MTRKPFVSQITGWVAGQRVQAGDRLLLTEDEARHEPVSAAPPDPVLEAGIEEPVQSAATAPSAARPARRRKAKGDVG